MNFIKSLFRFLFIIAFISIAISSASRQKKIKALENKLQKVLQSCSVATEGEDLKTPYGK